MTRLHYEIPDDLHRRAKAAAARQGVTLKQFLIDSLERQAGRKMTAKEAVRQEPLTPSEVRGLPDGELVATAIGDQPARRRRLSRDGDGRVFFCDVAEPPKLRYDWQVYDEAKWRVWLIDG